MRTLLLLGLAACGTRVSTPVPVASAEKPSHYQCGDTALNDQLTSGGERLTTFVPCWNQDDEAAIVHHDRVRRAHDDDLTALARAELQSCRGVPVGERDHSPLAHRRAMAQVIPHRQSGGGDIVGVRLVMKPVPGLTADYMRRAIRCNQARYAVLGGDADDPTLLPDADVTVFDRGGHLEVLVRAKTAADGAIAYERGQDLLHARTAQR